MADSVRLDKVLSDSGACTRREAARLIRRGAVLVDGTPHGLEQKKSIQRRSV
jgi:16S rRNA U516 pseudouridylate synthase RsuA-like enzyme